MKKYTVFCICCLALLVSAAGIHAQEGFTGSTSPAANRHGQAVMISQPISINEARNLPQNSWVILRGNIINNLPGGNIFTFRDSSGDIFVEIPRSVWRGITVDESNRVEISGEVMISRGQVSIRVRVLREI